MGFYVKVEGSKKLFYPLENNAQLDGEQLSAIRQLQIKGFTNIEKNTVDNQIELVYSVGGMQPLSQYLTNPQAKANEKALFTGILLRLLKVLQEVEKYPLLSVSNVVLDLDYIWIDPRQEIYCVYLPLMQDYQNLVVAWKKLIQDLLARAESDTGLLFLTKQLRMAEGQTYFSVAELYKQIEMEAVTSPNVAYGQESTSYRPESASPAAAQPHPQPQPMPSAQAYAKPEPAPYQPAAAQTPAQAPRATPGVPSFSGHAAQPAGNNIQMMQSANQNNMAPNQAKPVKTVKPPKVQGGGKFNVGKLIIGHLAIVLIALAMFFGGVLKNEEGNWDIFNLLILAVIVIGGLLLVWLKLAVNTGGSGKTVAPKPQKAKPGAAPKGAPGMAAPGMASPPRPTPQPAAQPSQPAQPQPQFQQQPQFQAPPVQAPVYENMGAMPEAAGTMVFSDDNAGQVNGTVVIEQEKGVFLTIKGTKDTRKITNTPFIVGRNGDWQISDSAISGRHFQIELQGGMFYLVDIGSKNGTLLGGNKVEVGQYYPLQSGSQIRAGNTELIFEVKE